MARSNIELTLERLHQYFSDYFENTKNVIGNFNRQNSLFLTVNPHQMIALHGYTELPRKAHFLLELHNESYAASTPCSSVFRVKASFVLKRQESGVPSLLEVV